MGKPAFRKGFQPCLIFVSDRSGAFFSSSIMSASIFRFSILSYLNMKSTIVLKNFRIRFLSLFAPMLFHRSKSQIRFEYRSFSCNFKVLQTLWRNYGGFFMRHAGGCPRPVHTHTYAIPFSRVTWVQLLFFRGMFYFSNLANNPPK